MAPAPVPDSDNRPDIVIFKAEMGLEVDLDISVAHIISKATKEDGAAASKRERKKQEKYEKELLSGGTHPTCSGTFWPLEWRS